MTPREIQTLRKLTEDEFKYCWYIEYGDPYHYIDGDGEIGKVIKGLLDAKIYIYLPNPIKPPGSPLYCRFTKSGRVLFLAHEWLMSFRHPTQLENGVTYGQIINVQDFDTICVDMEHRLAEFFLSNTL